VTNGLGTRSCVRAWVEEAWGKAGSSSRLGSDMGVNCMLSGRFHRGGGGGTDDRDVTDLERASRGGDEDRESFTLGSVGVDGWRCGLVW